jgi:molecular chaperone GrpE
MAGESDKKNYAETTDELKVRLEKAEEKANTYKELLERTWASFINYRRYIEREDTESHQRAISSLIAKLLPVLYMFNQAIESVPEDHSDLNRVQGINSMYRELLTVLEDAGLRRISAKGERFDPRLHEVFRLDQSGKFDEGIITEVLQEGYIFNDRLLRPARVAVSIVNNKGNEK